jgi:hypothetical protein
MMGLRKASWQRIGAALAGVALYVQLAFASWGMLGLAAPDAAGDVLGGHALCLAAQSGPGQPAQPQDAPAPAAHDHGAFCCLWHSLTAVQPIAAATAEPVAYAEIARGDLANLPLIAGPRQDPANARAPPTLS